MKGRIRIEAKDKKAVELTLKQLLGIMKDKDVGIAILRVKGSKTEIEFYAKDFPVKDLQI